MFITLLYIKRVLDFQGFKKSTFSLLEVQLQLQLQLQPQVLVLLILLQRQQQKQQQLPLKFTSSCTASH